LGEDALKLIDIERVSNQGSNATYETVVAGKKCNITLAKGHFDKDGKLSALERYQYSEVSIFILRFS
jgi:hypothetical protein